MDAMNTSETNVAPACFPVRLGDRLLDIIRAQLTPERYARTEQALVLAGRIAVIFAAAVGFCYGMVRGIRGNESIPIFWGFAWVPVALLLQYSAMKFADAGSRLIRTSPSEMASEAFLKCIAIILLLGGVVVLIAGIVMAIKWSVWYYLWAGVGVFCLSELIVCLCLNPGAMLNIKIESSTAGQEAIGVMSFLIKTGIRIVPIVYGVGAICGALVMLGGLVQLLRDYYPQELFQSGTNMLIGATLWPLASYLIFIFIYLGIDMAHALLSVPGKLDALRKDR